MTARIAKTNILLLAFVFSLPSIFGQDIQNELYVPRNVNKAYKKGTRSVEGKPGKNYWQNHGNYHISLVVMPPDRTIRGSEDITYFNNSPDTIKNLVFKLLQNVHRPGAQRTYPLPVHIVPQVDSLYITSGIHIDGYKENSRLLKWQNIFSAQFPSNTYNVIKLTEPLLPSDSIKLSVQWHYEISEASAREGMIDSTTYFIAYFYPRIAVYDDYQGWDLTEFADGYEFYNDFNDYTFNVRVPENYIVWATGTLLNSSEVLQSPYLEKFKRSLVTDELVRIADREDLLHNNVTSRNKTNLWKWKASNVTDITIAISDHYNWDASSVIVDKRTNRRASVQAAYSENAADFHDMVKWGKRALSWFSENWPGIPYPYEKSTIFQGYAGMEYPMMVNDESYQDTTLSKSAAFHEISHTYMPFYMGINETQYGFMDESWAVTFQYLIERIYLSPERAENNIKSIEAFWTEGLNFITSQVKHDYSADFDVPVMNLSNDFTGVQFNEYFKPALAYLALKEMLGDDQFKYCLQEYMKNWNGKHPNPWDFFNSFNSASGRNLDWFWKNWFFSPDYIDIRIRKTDKTSSGYNITVDNIGGMVIPFTVKLKFSDNTDGEIRETAGIWEANQRTAIINVKTGKSIKSVSLDTGIFLDSDGADNRSVK